MWADATKAAVRSLAFLAGLFVFAIAFDVLHRWVTGGFRYFSLKSQFEMLWLMALLIVPGSFLAFWRFGGGRVPLRVAVVLGFVHLGLLFAIADVVYWLDIEAKAFRMGLAYLFAIFGSFTLAWAACRSYRPRPA